jgi:hypothetical protein
MAGQWLRTKITDGKSETATAATFTDTINLPKTNFIGSILIMLKGTAAATHASATLTVNWIDIVGNGAAQLIHLTGLEVQKLMSFDFSGRQQTTSANGLFNVADGTATAANDQVAYQPYLINFGRFIGDTAAILPAKLFKTLQLKITYTVGTAALSSIALYVSVDEYVSDEDPAGKYILKKTELEAKATGTGDVDFDLPLGNAYRRFMLNVGTATTVTQVSLRANNGAEIPYTDDIALILIMNAYDYELMGTTTTLGLIYETNYFILDMDRADTLAKSIDTSQLNDLKLRISRGATTSTLTLVAEEIVTIG